MESDTETSGSERFGHVIDTWFRCPVCGSDGIGWDVDSEHISLSCPACGSEVREWIEDITSGREEP